MSTAQRAATQLIDYEGNFYPHALDHTSDIYSRGVDYSVITVLGCQSSGKSTLLNALFNTSFEVLDATFGRRQTTKGLWLAATESRDTLILDVEGTDSKERGEDRHTFENRAALFCLALADVVIVNMWYNDLGRYAASNYGLLRTVFAVNLELFQQVENAPKTILIFVIRDSVEAQSPLEVLETAIHQDIDHMWEELPKPEQMKDSKASDFFEIKVCGLPSKVFESEKFDQQVDALRHKLNTECRPFAYSRGIPADGFAYYSQEIWATILETKELNIPSQKEMLANFRCAELRTDAVQKATKEVPIWIAQAKTGTLNDDNLYTWAQSMLDCALEEYDTLGRRYHRETYLTFRQELLNSIGSAVQDVVDAQLIAVKDDVTAVAVANLEESVKTGNDLWTSYSNVVEEWKAQVLADFDSKAAPRSLVYHNTESGQDDVLRFTTDKARSSLEDALDAMVSSRREREIAALQEALHLRAQQFSFTDAEHYLTSPDLTSRKFWGAVHQHLLLIKRDADAELCEAWKGLQSTKNWDEVAYEAAVATTVADLKELLANMQKIMLNRFQTFFALDHPSVGEKRWLDVDEERIQKLFHAAQNRAFFLLDVLHDVEALPELGQGIDMATVADQFRLLLPTEDEEALKTRATEEMEEVLAACHCSRVSDGVSEKALQTLPEVLTAANQGNVDAAHFSTWAQKMLDAALEDYDGQTSKHPSHVASAMRQQLVDSLYGALQQLSQIVLCFTGQAKAKSAAGSLRTWLTSTPERERWTIFNNRVEEWRAQTMDEFSTAAASMDLKFRDTATNIDKQLTFKSNGAQKLLGEELSAFAEKQRVKEKAALKKELETLAETFPAFLYSQDDWMSPTLPREHFWKFLHKQLLAFKQVADAQLREAWEGLNGIEGWNDGAYEAAIAAARVGLKEVWAGLHNILLDRFQAFFTLEQLGVPRWQDTSEESIQSLFVKARARSLEVIDVLHAVEELPALDYEKGMELVRGAFTTLLSTEAEEAIRAGATNKMQELLAAAQARRESGAVMDQALEAVKDQMSVAQEGGLDADDFHAWAQEMLDETLRNHDTPAASAPGVTLQMRQELLLVLKCGLQDVAICVLDFVGPEIAKSAAVSLEKWLIETPEQKRWCTFTTKVKEWQAAAMHNLHSTATSMSVTYFDTESNTEKALMFQSKKAQDLLEKELKTFVEKCRSQEIVGMRRMLQSFAEERFPTSAVEGFWTSPAISGQAFWGMLHEHWRIIKEEADAEFFEAWKELHGVEAWNDCVYETAVVATRSKLQAFCEDLQGLLLARFQIFFTPDQFGAAQWQDISQEDAERGFYKAKNTAFDVLGVLHDVEALPEIGEGIDMHKVHAMLRDVLPHEKEESLRTSVTDEMQRALAVVQCQQIAANVVLKATEDLSDRLTAARKSKMSIPDFHTWAQGMLDGTLGDYDALTENHFPAAALEGRQQLLNSLSSAILDVGGFVLASTRQTAATNSAKQLQSWLSATEEVTRQSLFAGKIEEWRAAALANFRFSTNAMIVKYWDTECHKEEELTLQSKAEQEQELLAEELNAYAEKLRNTETAALRRALQLLAEGTFTRQVIEDGWCSSDLTKEKYWKFIHSKLQLCKQEADKKLRNAWRGLQSDDEGWDTLACEVTATAASKQFSNACEFQSLQGWVMKRFRNSFCGAKWKKMHPDDTEKRGKRAEERALELLDVLRSVETLPRTLNGVNIEKAWDEFRAALSSDKRTGVASSASERMREEWKNAQKQYIDLGGAFFRGGLTGAAVAAAGTLALGPVALVAAPVCAAVNGIIHCVKREE